MLAIRAAVTCVVTKRPNPYFSSEFPRQEYHEERQTNAYINDRGMERVTASRMVIWPGMVSR